MARRELTDLTVILVREMDRAICVQLDEEHDEVWLPKSMVEFEMTGRKTLRGRRVAVVTLPESLAMEKELI